MTSSIDLGVLATFAVLWAAIVPTPGANSLMVAHIALVGGPRRMLTAIAGNMAGIALIALAALLGMELLLQSLPWLRTALFLGGAAYLVHFGLRLLLQGGGSALAIGAGRSDASAGSGWQSFRLGFLTQLANVQAIVFVTSLFAVAGVLGSTPATGLAAVLVMVALNACWLTMLGSLLLLPAPRRLYLRFGRLLQRLFGLLFVGLGLRLVWRELVRS